VNRGVAILGATERSVGLQRNNKVLLRAVFLRGTELAEQQFRASPSSAIGRALPSRRHRQPSSTEVESRALLFDGLDVLRLSPADKLALQRRWVHQRSPTRP
jgi:hypothetical protein